MILFVYLLLRGLSGHDHSRLYVTLSTETICINIWENCKNFKVKIFIILTLILFYAKNILFMVISITTLHH